jgi:hypothetical protein
VRLPPARGAAAARVASRPLTPPQLFGHEIVAVLCGVVWSLPVGFAIVAAGTFIGEVGNF